MQNISIKSIEEADIYFKIDTNLNIFYPKVISTLLLRYIENNPLEASLIDKISQYPYTLSYMLFNNKIYNSCCNESILIKEFDLKTLNEFLGEPMNEQELEYLKSKAKQKVYKKGNDVKISQLKQFQEHFYDISTKLDRNLAIINACEDGYTQVSIANYLNLSTSLISKVIKSGDSLTGV